MLLVMLQAANDQLDHTTGSRSVSLLCSLLAQPAKLVAKIRSMAISNHMLLFKVRLPELSRPMAGMESTFRLHETTGVKHLTVATGRAQCHLEGHFGSSGIYDALNEVALKYAFLLHALSACPDSDGSEQKALYDHAFLAAVGLGLVVLLGGEASFILLDTAANLAVVIDANLEKKLLFHLLICFCNASANEARCQNQATCDDADAS